jgi:tetratricopeptide (TPR) repeat protein
VLGERALTSPLGCSGAAYLHLGNVDEARTRLERALENHTRLYSAVTPERADIWVALASVRVQVGNVPGAIAFAADADAFWTHHDPTSRWAGEAAYWLGRARQASGDTAAAAEAFHRARRILSSSQFRIDSKLMNDVLRMPQRPHALTTRPFACRRCLGGGEPRHSRDSYSRRPFTGSSTTV